MKAGASILAMATLVAMTIAPADARHHHGCWDHGDWNHHDWKNGYYNNAGWHRPFFASSNPAWGPPRWLPPAFSAYPPGRRIGWYKHHCWY